MNLIKNNFIIAASIIGVYFILNKLLFIIPSQASYLVPDQLNLKNLGSTFLLNLNNYFLSIHTFFRGLGRYEFLKITASSLAVVSLLTGMIYKYKEKIDFIDFLVAIYLVTIMFLGGNYRYLFPMLPFLVYYMVIGLERIKLNLNINMNIVISVLGVFVLMQYYPEDKWIINNQEKIKNGPQETASVEAFGYIKKNIPKNSVIVFVKPRALALYTDRIGMINEPTSDLKKLKSKFEKMGANYLLIHTELTPETKLIKYIEEYKDEVKFIWNNEKFFLYKIK